MVRAPDEVTALLARSRVNVAGTIDGIPCANQMMPGGDGHVDMPVRRSLRDAGGSGPGDLVTIRLRVATARRAFEVPPDLETTPFADPAARAAWDRLAHWRRREHAIFIAEAKRPETRERRAARVIATLRGA